MIRTGSMLTALAASLLLCGCQTEQSAMHPQGPRAEEIAQLAWMLFGLAAIVLAIVLVALLLALQGPPGIRARIGGQGIVIAGGIVFPAVTLTVLLVYGVWLMRADVRAAENDNSQGIEVVGEQWWWRVAYAGAGGSPFASANELRIPVGREIDLTLKSADVIHSFWVPSLAGKMDMVPGRTTRLRVRADRPGVFRGQCAEYCGGPHALMALPVIAMPAGEYDEWFARQAAPASEPTTAVEQRGQALFLAAGCGACHTIRGTPASGMVGPDLTHVGSRRSLAAGTLAMTQANLVRFIVDGQHVKPGNLMPPFRIFSDAERDALAAYLLSLR
jgi:cytochrome c oxidase subunit 2